jgi:acetyltransferase EpsM
MTANANRMRHLVIGAAGHAQEVAWALDARARADGRRIEILFFDDAVPPGSLPCGLGGVVGTLDDAATCVIRGATELVLGVALPRLKAALTARLTELDLPWTTVVHPGAIVGPNVRLGAGTYVAAGAVVTVNARVGRFATINVHAGIAHDSTLDDLVTLHPHAHLSGNVHVGEGVEIGAGATVIPAVHIGAWAMHGAGCVAVRSLRGARTYVGVPARDAHGLGASAHSQHSQQSLRRIG